MATYKKRTDFIFDDPYYNLIRQIDKNESPFINKKIDRLAKDEFSFIANDLEAGLSIKHCAKKYQLSISKINRLIKEFSFKNSRLPRYNLKVREFKIVDELTAYIYGFLFADGSISDNRLTITLHKKDIEFIMYINKYFFGDFIAYKISGCYVNFRLSSQPLIESLIDLGFGLNDYRHFPSNIPCKLIRHFIRGAFDGDGCISTGTTSIAGRMFQLKELGDYLESKKLNGFTICHSSKSKKGLSKYKPYGSLKYSNPYICYIYHYLYFDANFYLERKKNIFLDSFSRIENIEEIFAILESEFDGVAFNGNEIWKKSPKIKNNVKYIIPHSFQRDINIRGRLSDENILIKKQLGDGVPRADIAKNLNTNTTMLDRVIKEKHIESLYKKKLNQAKENIESLVQDIINGKSLSDLAKELGLTVRVLRKHVITFNKVPRQVQPDFSRPMFESLSDEELFYFLGLLIGRSSFDLSENRISVNIKEAHIQIYTQLLSMIYYDKIPKLHKVKRRDKWKHQISNRKFIQILLGYGFQKGKLETPKNIPNDSFHHLLRGHFEARFSFNKREKAYLGFKIPGNHLFLEWLNDRINHLYGIYPDRIESRDKSSRLIFNMDSSYKLVKQMYANSTIYISDLLKEYNKYYK